MAKTVIIGGGIIGLACARELRRRGEDVILLDARTPGTGASAANAGYIVMTLSGPVPTPGLVKQSLKWMLNPESPLYIKPRFSPAFLSWLVRFWRACNNSAFEAGLKSTTALRNGTAERLDQWIADGIDFEMNSAGRIFAYSEQGSMESGLQSFEGSPYPQPMPLYGNDLWDFEPALSEEIVAGFHVEADRTVQPLSLVDGLLAKLHGEGVEVRTGAPVVELEVSQNRVVAVRTPTETIAADHVLIAAGAWSGEIAKMAGARIPVEAGKGYGLDYTPAPVRPRRSISLKNAQIAVSPFNNGLRLGGTMELSGISDTLNLRRVDAIAKGGKRFLREFPEDAEPTHVWTGMRPMAPDGLPVIGLLPGFRNLSVASGHSMLGVTLAPTTAVHMAELITTGRTPEVLLPFTPNRFKGVF